MTDEPARLAILLDGPSWWGAPTIWPDGTVVDVKQAPQFAVRAKAANLEVAASRALFDDLPAGVLVLHPVERGAGFVWAEAATSQGFSTVAVSGDDLSFRLVELADGLVRLGWKVKARLSVPQAGKYLGYPILSERWLSTCTLLAERKIPFKYVPPLEPPPPEPDPEPPVREVSINAPIEDLQGS